MSKELWTFNYLRFSISKNTLFSNGWAISTVCKKIILHHLIEKVHKYFFLLWWIVLSNQIVTTFGGMKVNSTSLYDFKWNHHCWYAMIQNSNAHVMPSLLLHWSILLLIGNIKTTFPVSCTFDGQSKRRKTIGFHFGFKVAIFLFLVVGAKKLAPTFIESFGLTKSIA